MNPFTNAALLACAFALPAQRCAADTITLKSTIHLSGDEAALTLADLAELDGSEALQFSTLPITGSLYTNVPCEIQLSDVRRMLEDAGVHWGRVHLRGRSVRVQPAASIRSSAPQAMTPADLPAGETKHGPSKPQRMEHCAAALMNQPTLAGTISSLIAGNLQLDPQHLRLSFDRADESLLNTPTHATRLEVQPLSSFASDRLEFAIRTWAEGKPQAVRTISVHPQVRVEAAVLVHDLTRDQVIAESDVQSAERWIVPSQATLTATRIAAIGRVTTRNLKAGETLRTSHIRRDALVKRGELVTVRCLVGGVAISLQAEARADGLEGDAVEFRKPGERETFLATVTRRGEAVIDLSRN